MATVDSVGRRPLLLGGVSGMVVALVGLGVASIQLQGSAAAWTSVAALLAYVGAYQVRRSCSSTPATAPPVSSGLTQLLQGLSMHPCRSTGMQLSEMNQGCCHQSTGPPQHAAMGPICSGG